MICDGDSPLASPRFGSKFALRYMAKSSERTHINLRGVRQNNLKNFDLNLPLKRLIVVTGLSGSGKSSLAFETLFAEGQRRYIETFSPYARQFFDRMDKPAVDSIQGIPPAIAIEQRNTVKTTRSTVGTMTEVNDYMKVLWPHVAVLHCQGCGQRVSKDSPARVWEAAEEAWPEREVLITFDLPLTERVSYSDSLALIARQGYQRLLAGGQVVRLEEALQAGPVSMPLVTVVQDRLRVKGANRARFVEACEQAYHFGKGKLAVRSLPSSESERGEFAARFFSDRLHCAACDLDYREPAPALFSFNHPSGACVTCRGFGRVIGIDYSLALPDWYRTLAEGVVKPWQTGQGQECQTDLLRVCREQNIPVDVPFAELPEKWRRLVIEGEPEYGKDPAHEWPRAWYGVKGYFRWLESKAYKMHVRVLLSRYRSYTQCPDCGGTRFRPEALLYRVSTGAGGDVKTLTLPEFYRMPVRDAATAVRGMKQRVSGGNQTLRLALGEVESRLGYLNEVGLGYLTLDRPTRTLSGGETERVNLTTCLGTCLVNTLFILDEPSVGLHPRDTSRLVRILEQLRETGNTVVVVEHEPLVMRAADQVVDLGPGHGVTGGEVVFQGTYRELLKDRNSITGAYLSGRRAMDAVRRRPVQLMNSGTRLNWQSDLRGGSRVEAEALHEAARPFGGDVKSPGWLVLEGATRHNLKNVTLRLPLGRLVTVTGVSGSGKSTLIREVLMPALSARLGAREPGRRGADELAAAQEDGPGEREGADAKGAMLTGAEHIAGVVVVDQSSLSKTPRSNPAVYIGAFEHIRDCFAQTDLARRRGLNSSAFSFNSGQGQCQRCRGAGFEKIEMQFLSDVFIRCPDCDGRRYRPHILEVKLEIPGREGTGWSIGDLLDATVEEAIEFLSNFTDMLAARRAMRALELLSRVGLGYVKVGQPINTLSGGESQRLKLVRHLAAAADSAEAMRAHRERNKAATGPTEPLLFLFDEPTTGLHFDDIRVLLRVFQELVDAGHSLVVIEHNLDVIRAADWVIDLGPDAGDQGGEIVVEGTPEEVAACARSHTGRALAQEGVARRY